MFGHKSLMNHSFSQIPDVNIQRSILDRSHSHKTTFDSGILVPILVDEVLPGDTFNCNMTGFCRLLTPVVPCMDNIYLDTFFFFVPNRLLWKNWMKFCGEKNSDDTTEYLIPIIDPATWVGTFTEYSSAEHMGIPHKALSEGAGGVDDISALPFLALYMIWRDWFRDQNLQKAVDFHGLAEPDFGDGPYNATYIATGSYPRCKRPDYFTSCLPWPQKGPAVELPLGTVAPVSLPGYDITDGARVSVLDKDGALMYLAKEAATNYIQAGTDTGTAQTQLYADLSEATAATISSLRTAFQVQKWYERLARGGSRYVEIIRSFFNVTLPELLYRPEFLGGGSTGINMHPIPQTSATGATGTPQGNLAAFGTCVTNKHGFRKSFTEHGWVIGIASVRADLSYQYGLERFWTRRTLFDFYWPQFAHLSEQAVLNKEIYCQLDSVLDGGEIVNNKVFGYQERYAEYRYKPSLVTGGFRSNLGAGSFDVWHLSEEFSALPELEYGFITAKPPIERITAVANAPEFYADFYFDYKCARPMPVYGVPGLIDHF